MINYDKIVRDRIPEIIKKSGSNPVTEILDNDGAIIYLEKKLEEELEEYKGNRKLEELADILEVIDAIALKKGFSFEELLALKEDKRKARGGFKENILLKYVD